MFTVIIVWLRSLFGFCTCIHPKHGHGIFHFRKAMKEEYPRRLCKSCLDEIKKTELSIDLQLCPVCKSTLVYANSGHYETLDEHVCNPNDEPCLKNSYKCSNNKCYTHSFGVVWLVDGEMFCNEYDFKEELLCIMKNNAPFGSWERKMNVEVYKKGVRKEITLLNLYFVIFKLAFNYTADYNGDVVCKTIGLQTWYKGDVGYYLYISGIRMLRYSISKFYGARKKYYEYVDNNYVIKNLLAEMKGSESDKRWWYLISHWYINTFYKSLRLELEYKIIYNNNN